MGKVMASPVVVFRGQKGKEIYNKIVNTKVAPIDHAKKAAELRSKLERRGVRF